MVGLSPYGEGQILTPLTTSAYVSLHTADPVTTGANELSGGGYARQSAAFTNAGNEPTVASNSAIVTYPAATAGWGTITHFGVWDAVTAGNFRGSGALTTAKTVLLPLNLPAILLPPFRFPLISAARSILALPILPLRRP